MKKKLALIIVLGVYLFIQSLSAQTWEPTKRLTYNLGSNSDGPVVAIDSSNIIHVVWFDSNPGNWEIFYKRSTDGGTTWTTKRLTYNSGDSYYPAIAVDSSNNIHVVWYDLSPGNWEIYYKRSTDGGATWSVAKRLTYNSGWSKGPAIAIDSSNNIHVVWNDDSSGNYEIFHKHSTNGGTTWTTKRLTWNSGDSWLPTIAIDSSNIIHVVWYDYSLVNSEIFYKKSTNGGTTWSVAKRLTYNSGWSYGPVVAIDSSNIIHVVWYDYSPGNWEIFYKQSTNGGITWSAAKKLTKNPGESLYSVIAVDLSNNIHVLWQDSNPGNPEIFYKRSTDGGTTWTTKRLTWNSGISKYPAIAVDSNNHIHVVWEDWTPGNWEIFYKKGIQ